MTRNELLDALRCSGDDAASLPKRAREIRDRIVGKAVYLRGLVEFSNHCRRFCNYCGINAANLTLSRYRLTDEEIVSCAHVITAHDIGTIVLQSGEDLFFTAEKMAAIIARIKRETPLAVTLSLGERPVEDLQRWRDAGADRYLLRFETSDRKLLDAIHPPSLPLLPARIEQLHLLRDLGFEVGSGIMVGLPGQTYKSVVDDLLLFQSLDLDMIGIGPYIPDPDTPLARQHSHSSGTPTADNVPNTVDFTCKVIALTRLLCPSTNIPCTTALKTIDATGCRGGLMAGCNVIMPNVTPIEYSRQYAIYPGKKGALNLKEHLECIRNEVEAAGCVIGTGPGASRHFREREETIKLI